MNERERKERHDKSRCAYECSFSDARKRTAAAAAAADTSRRIRTKKRVTDRQRIH